ncbi:hypothetical protein MN608_11372 [Microdochium nivale]|nr:hypothetical protein MN608_11372 [Microdochium nivale]
MAAARGQLLFVQSSASYSAHPPTVSSSRRDTCAHAARVTHARKRLARVEQYQSRQQKSAAAARSHPLTTTTTTSCLTAHRRDPFSRFTARRLADHEHLLLDHFLRVTIPHQAAHCLCTACTAQPQQQRHRQENQPPDARGRRTCRVVVFTDLARLAVTSRGTLDGLLLAAHRQMSSLSRRLRRDAATPGDEASRRRHDKDQSSQDDCEALRLRVGCMQSLRVAMAGGVVSAVTAGEEGGHGPVAAATTLVMVLFLVADELWHGEHETAKAHMAAAMHMTQHWQHHEHGSLLALVDILLSELGLKGGAFAAFC